MKTPRHRTPRPELAHESWFFFAECDGEDPNLFFPSTGELNKIRDAKAICRKCEVADDCLAYAIRYGIDFGIWGGTTARERLRNRRLKANPEDSDAA